VLRKILIAFLLAGGFLPGPPLASAFAQSVPPSAAPAADPNQTLLDQINLPFETFTLANGLRVVVHEDRKAPVVAVSVWYNVGSKDEPAGRSGFAHLFEHLMFNGSENAPGDYFSYTSAIGATDLNGTTSFDRTNYFETVPRGALERALFLESDRMGHLLGAVTQENLTNQIGVVQNEKRQGDNRPFGMVQYAQLEALYPVGHPYHHTTIGSMADISASSLGTVQDWFRGHYGPNNAVVVLAGDIEAAEARPLVERYFGGIARGPVNTPAAAPVPTLPARVDRTLHDHVANTRLYRTWVVPGMTDADVVPLQVGATILGGLSSSRLDNALVRGEQSAVQVTADVDDLQRVSQFEVVVDVKPGQDADAVSRRLDAIIADFVANGPTDDEVSRAMTRTLSGTVASLEKANGQAAWLAQGMLYANDPAFYHRRLERMARVTPAEVRTAMQRWLRRPVLALRVDPGDREPYQEPPGRVAAQAASTPAPTTQPHVPRPMPAIGAVTNLDLPQVERARLSNGMQVIYARRTALPMTRIAVSFNAGSAAEPANQVGIQTLMLGLLTQGTTSLNSTQLAEAQERLGAQIGANAGQDRTTISLSSLTTNLDPSLDLLADVILRPAFAPAEVERLRQQQLAAISSELTQPQGMAARVLPGLLYGPDHPYGRPGGSGSADAVRALTRDDLLRFHDAWIRPDNATIFAVGDLPLADLVARLERRLGAWQAPATPRGVKHFGPAIPEAHPRIVLIDRPQSPQSLIIAAELLGAEGTQDLFDLDAANDVLGGDFLARINMELRERRGWSYGARGGIGMAEHQVRYVIQAPVQADRTGESVQAIIDQVHRFLTANGVQADELHRVIEGNTRQLPGQFQTSSALLGALMSNALYRRPDNYYETIAGRYQALNAATLDTAARRYIDPARFVWVVVGDAQRVRPQLERLGIPIEVARPS
jgi:zinc protease